VNQLKVYEFAKQIGVETLVLMDKIREWQLPIKSHMATLDESMMAEIEERLKVARLAAEEAAKPKKKTVRKKTEATAPAVKKNRCAQEAGRSKAAGGESENKT